MNYLIIGNIQKIKINMIFIKYKVNTNSNDIKYLNI